MNNTVVAPSDEHNAQTLSFSDDRGVAESTSREGTTSSVSYESATFAGGCFWCLQGPFDAQEGVYNAQVGYAGGSKEDANYTRVCTGRTKHREAIHMDYDPEKVSYETLVDIFFRQIDPTDPHGQFNDQGPQYTTAIYYHSEEQKQIAEKVITRINDSKKFDKSVATKVEPFTTFFPAEEEHQAYYTKNPLRYGMYKLGSGRANFIDNNWVQ